MAESPLKNLLVCSICLDQYNEPKILPCHHSFCKECLTLVPLELNNENYTLRCPTCREQTQLPGKDATTFPASFLINSLLEVQHKKEKISEKSNICEEHGKPCDVFCEDCDKAICHHCLLRQHQKHSNSLLTDSYSRNIQLITKLLSQINNGVVSLETASTVLEKTDKEIVEQERLVERDVNSVADEKIYQINQCRQKLLQKTRNIAERKIATISIQKSQAKATLKRVRTCEESVHVFLQQGTQQLLLERKSQVMSELESIIKMLETDSFVPGEMTDLVFHANDSEEAFGIVNATLINESFKGANDIIIATRNKKSHFVVIHKPNSSFRPSTKMFSYQLLPVNGTQLENNVCEVRCFEDVYQIYFTPVATGPHHLAINVVEYPIMGSPFIVHVFPSLAPRKIINSIKSPYGIAVKDNGTLIISENGKNRVCIFDASNRRYSFPCQKPVGLAITPDDCIIVADEANKQIKKFDIDGRLLVELERSGSFKAVVPVPTRSSIPYGVSGSFKAVVHVPTRSSIPYGVSVCQDGRIYVTETNSGNFRELNSDLTITKQESGYNSPTGIAVDSKDNVFITSKSNNNVIKWNRRTGVMMTFGCKGSGEGQLRHPMGIAIDSNDVVYVADTNNNRISIFDCNGHFLMSLGQKGNGSNEFNEPCGIAIDKTGRLYISDTGNDRIVIYQ